MMHDNEKWQTFVADLKARGCFIKWAWTARTDGKPVQGVARKPKLANIGQVQFIGNGFQPATLWSIVIDYGVPLGDGDYDKGAGFALCVDAGGKKISEEVDAIVGPNAPTREALADLKASVI